MNALVTADKLALYERLYPTYLTLAAGELICVIGPNGSGKTSLLHALAGIGGPIGRVRIKEENPWTAPPSRRPSLISYLPASRDIAWPLLGRDLVRLGLTDDCSERIDELFEWLELASIAGRRVDRLSTGERSRLLIARALAPDAKLLLLDEPTANLDPLWQLRLMDHLRDLVRQRHCTAILAVHDLDLARRYADRLLIMERSRVAADGRPGELLASSQIPEVFGIEMGDDGGWRPA